VETVLPAQAARFEIGWSARPDAARPGRQNVLAAAIGRETLGAAVQAGQGCGAGSVAVVPSLAALAGLWAQQGEPGAEPTLLVDVAARYTGLACCCHGMVVACAVVDHGGDDWTERIADALGCKCEQAEQYKLNAAAGAAAGASPPAAPAPGEPVLAALQDAVGTWSRQLREGLAACAAELDESARAKRCVLFGRAAQAPGVAAAAERALGMEVRLGELPTGLIWACPADAGALPAIAAACAALEPAAPVPRLRQRRQRTARRRSVRLWLRWAAVAGWLVAALAGLYVADGYRAGRLQRRLAEARSRVGGSAALERKLSVGRFLEAPMPGPLETLDRLSQAIEPGVVLTRWTYDRQGGVGVAGAAPSEKVFLKVHDKLAQLGQVSWRTGRPEKDTFTFEVRLRLDPTLPGWSGSSAGAQTSAEARGESDGAAGGEGRQP
jgi:hypothetical protein